MDKFRLDMGEIGARYHKSKLDAGCFKCCLEIHEGLRSATLCDEVNYSEALQNNCPVLAEIKRIATRGQYLMPIERDRSFPEVEDLPIEPVVEPELALVFYVDPRQIPLF